MGLILLEALLVLVILAFMVWWTMFSGRKDPRPGRTAEPLPPPAAPGAAPPRPQD